MTKTGFFILSIMAIFSVQADTYQCKQENGSYLFSDMPCTTANQILKETKIDYDGVVVYLSVNSEPTPLPNRIVDQFLNNIDTACQEKNNPKMLSYFSQEAQQKLKKRMTNDSVFSVAFAVCNNVSIMNNEVKKSKSPILFASKKPNKSIELCLYTAQKGIENCLGNLKVIAEKGDLKLDMP